MKNYFIFLFAILLINNCFGQEIFGDWYGKLSITEKDLRINFHIIEDSCATGKSYSSTMDSPDQNALGLVTDSTIYKNDTLRIYFANITYTATLDKHNNLDGTFVQSSHALKLYMTHNETTDSPPKKVIRKQEPQPPFPYQSQEVSFQGGGDYTLCGTLVTPNNKKNIPIAVFVSGSGAQDRDESLENHKPFLVIADYLARNGIASLRYDDRGIGKSGGHFNLGTSMDNANDASSAVMFLKNKGYCHIGIIGHSEGGLIAPIVAAKDSMDIRFIVSLAGTGVSGFEISKMQSFDISAASGQSEEELLFCKYSDLLVEDILKLDTITPDILKEKTKAFIENTPAEIMKGFPKMSVDEYINDVVSEFTNQWTVFFMKYDPAEAWAKVKCPVLALNGEKDLQVDATINLNAIDSVLKSNGNNSVITKTYPELNHLFQHCTTGAPDEYAKIDETISPEVLEDITGFIKGTPKTDNSNAMIYLGIIGLVIIILLSFYFVRKRK